MVLFLIPFSQNILFAITGNEGEPINRPSSFWCTLEPNWNYVISKKNVNISIMLSLEILEHSPTEGSDLSLLQTTDRVSFVGTLAKQAHSVETQHTFEMDEIIYNCIHKESRVLFFYKGWRLGDWTISSSRHLLKTDNCVEYHFCKFLRDHKCVVAYCNVESTQSDSYSLSGFLTIFSLFSELNSLTFSNYWSEWNLLIFLTILTFPSPLLHGLCCRYYTYTMLQGYKFFSSHDVRFGDRWGAWLTPALVSLSISTD